MDIMVILLQMIQLFLLIALGYGLRLIGMLDKELSRRLTTFVLDVTTPAMILSSVLSGDGGQDRGRVLMMLAISVGMYVLLPAVSWILTKLMRVPAKEQGLYLFMTVFSNVGYMGFPVIRAVFGEEAILYTAIVNLVFNLAVFTAGRMMMNLGSGKKTAVEIKSLISPGVVSSFVTLFIYFAGWKAPEIIASTVSMVGDMTTPLAMMLIGFSLAAVPVREVFSEFRIYPYTLLRQVALPALAYPVLRMLVPDALLLGITLVILAMPVGSIAVLFATEYGRDEALAAKTVFLTTLLSIGTIPLIVALFLT